VSLRGGEAFRLNFLAEASLTLLPLSSRKGIKGMGAL
jgi:hypothetical protein